MPNPVFRFKQFGIDQDRCAMKVTTDGCLFGAWVAHQLRGKGQGKALDIGAGTGLLSLMVAQQSGLCIDAVEIDGGAAAQARENVNNSPWAQKIAVHNLAIQDFFPQAFYPVIFANPPFYENELPSPKSNRSVAHHGTGLRLQELLLHTGRLLDGQGTAFLLFPFKRDRELELELQHSGFFVHQKVVVHPSAAHPPFRVMLALKKYPSEQFAPEIVYIKALDGQYTPAFTGLLQEYYLYL